MEGLRPQIERALWNELRCGGDVGRSRAAVALAALLRNRGELDAARELLDYAPATADPPAAARAWLACAELLEETGEESEALRAYRQAAELASPRHSPDVAMDLAARAQENGNARGAARLYEAVIALSAAPALVAVAGLRLAAIQLGRGQEEAAIASLRAARGRSGPALLPDVELALAEALLGSDAGDADRRTEAEELLSSVLASDHPDLAPQAALRLGCELGARGELARAHELLGAVIDSRHPEFAPLAAAETSRLMHRELASLSRAEDPGRRPSPPSPAATPPRDPDGAAPRGPVPTPPSSPDVVPRPPGIEACSGAHCDGALWHLDGLLGVRGDAGRGCGPLDPDHRLIRIEFARHMHAEVDLLLPRRRMPLPPPPLPLSPPGPGPGLRGMLAGIRDFLVGPPLPRPSSGGSCAWTVRFEAEALAVRLARDPGLDPDSSLFLALRLGAPDPGLRELLLALVAWRRNPDSGLIEIDWRDPGDDRIAGSPEAAPVGWRDACTYAERAWGQLEAELPANRISLLLKGEWEPLHGLEERRRRAEAAVVAESVEAILVPQPVAL